MKNYLAISFLALSVLAMAEPVDKRDTVWVTRYTEVVETTYETATVWVPYPTGGPSSGAATGAAQAEPSSAAPASAATGDDSSVNSADGSHEAPEPSVAPAAPVASQVLSSAAPAQDKAPATPSPAPAPSPQPAQDNSGGNQAASPPTAPAATSGGSGQSYSGEMTYYDPGMGSCGITSSSSEPIVAISHILMDPKNPGNPNNNPLCGKMINITYNGKTTEAKIVDRCVSCAEGDLDMSSSLFQTVAGDLGQGRVSGMTWTFAD